MKRIFPILLGLLLISSWMVSAQETMYIYKNNVMDRAFASSEFDSAKVESSTLKFYKNNTVVYSSPVAEINEITFQQVATSTYKLYLDGYEGTSVKLVFSNDAEQNSTIRNGGVADIPDSYINQVLKSVSLDGGTPVLIGRTVNGDIRLKLNGSALTFRDPVSGSIPVGSIAEFQLIQTDATTLAGTYKQEADLDLLNLAWSLVGQDNAVFTGSFTGTGYKINNLNVNRGANNTGGLFGRISGATITGVHVASGSVSGKQYIGGVVGRSTASTISDCINEASVTGTSSVIGGICGNMENGGTITGCVNKGTVGSTESVGGIVGATTGSTGTAVIKGCYNTGKVEMNSGNVGRIGGIIGDIGNNVSSPCLVEILACRNDGSISGNNLIGGIVGDNRTGAATPHTVTACYNMGEVDSGTGNGGGICGRAYKITITACYHAGSMTGSTKRYVLAVLQSGGSCSYADCWYLEATGVSVAPSGVTGTASAFTDSQWPSASDNGWAVGNGTSGYWKSLGSYGGSYPTLYWE